MQNYVYAANWNVQTITISQFMHQNAGIILCWLSSVLFRILIHMYKIYWNQNDIRKQKENLTLPCSFFIYEDGKSQQHPPTLKQHTSRGPRNMFLISQCPQSGVSWKTLTLSFCMFSLTPLDSLCRFTITSQFGSLVVIFITWSVVMVLHHFINVLPTTCYKCVKKAIYDLDFFL